MKHALSVSSILLIVYCAGCSHTVRYNSNHVPNEAIFATLGGKGLVVTDDLQDERHEKSSPSSITGAALIIEFAIGDISREVTKTVFGRRFKQGIFHANEIAASSNYTAIIEPKITSLNWRFNQLKNLGFAVTPEANVALKITLKDKAGSVLSNKTYSSGWVSGGSYMLSFSPQEKVNIAVHRAVFTAAVKAADDLVSFIEPKTNPKPTNLKQLESVFSLLRESYPTILIQRSSEDTQLNPTLLPNSYEKH